MMLITVICSTGRNNPLSAIIRWVTKSPVSHAVIGFEIFGMAYVLQADIGGVQVALRQKWVKKNRIVAEFGCRLDLQEALQKTLQQIGDDYDYVGMLGFIPVLFWRWLHRKIKNPLASPSKDVCTELVLGLNADRRIAEWVDLEGEGTTAGDILERCDLNKNFFPLPLSLESRQ